MRLAASRSLLLALALAGCSLPVRRHDWSQYHGPGRELLLAEEVPFPAVPDPLEPANRVSAGLTLGLMRAVVAPLTRVYRFFVPEGVRESLQRAGENLLYPRRLVGNLLQADLGGGARETGRFLINSTMGALGLFDPATELGLRASPEDLGQVLAAWGWKPSTYLFLPLLGPSTVRDGVGRVGDLFLDPLQYVHPLAPWARGFNRVAGSVEGTLRASEAQYDAYQLARLLYVRSRELEATNFSLRGDDTGEVQTLGSIFLAPRDPDFYLQAETHTVALEGGRSVTYSLWLHPERGSLVLLVPGLGSHRLSDSAVGAAEVIHGLGHSVATISSTMNPEFMTSAASTPLPGFLPVDAADVRQAVEAIDADVVLRHGDLFRHHILAGFSLGGLQTLAIAADEEALRRRFDVYVAVDPPASVEHAARTLDAFYNAPLAFPPEERQERIESVLSKVLYLSSGELQPDMELPFREWEAEFLIGLAFRTLLQAVVLQSQDLHDQGILRTRRTRWRRASAFVEASEYSFLEYLYAFVLPYYAERLDTIDLDEAGAREMLRRSGLRAYEEGLRANPDVRVFANANDFLLRQEDLDWLRGVLDERLVVFAEGGHLGNLHRAGIQASIRAVVERAADEADASGDAPTRP